MEQKQKKRKKKLRKQPRKVKRKMINLIYTILCIVCLCAGFFIGHKTSDNKPIIKMSMPNPIKEIKNKVENKKTNICQSEFNRTMNLFLKKFFAVLFKNCFSFAMVIV